MRSQAIRYMWSLLAMTAAFVWAVSVAYAQTNSTGLGVSERAESTWSIDAHFGLTSPQGSAGSALNSDIAYGLTVEYRFNSTWAAELYAGQDTFEVSGIGADVDVSRIALSGKAYFTQSPFRGYAAAGFGTYDFSPGPSENGFTLATGLLWDIWQRTSIDGRVEYHDIDVSGASFNYYTFLIGLKYYFR